MTWDLAQFGPSDEWMPFVLGLIVFMIPIIAILTAHQQKMARILREGQPQPGGVDEIAALRGDIARLTQAVHQNTIAIDNMMHRSALPENLGRQAEEPPQFTQGQRRLS